MGLQRGYSRPSGRRLPPASSLNPRETRKWVGVPDGPKRSLTGPQSPAPCLPRARLCPSSEAPHHALPALIRQPGPRALVPTAGPPAVKTVSKESPAAPSSLKGPACPPLRGRGCPPTVGLGARVPVWTGGGPRSELRPNAQTGGALWRARQMGHASLLCASPRALWAGRQGPVAKTWGFDRLVMLGITQDHGRETSRPAMGTLVG